MSCTDLPIIDLSQSIGAGANRTDVAREIHNACRQQGFFYINGHGIDPDLFDRLEELSRQFFEQDLDTKLRIRMERSGRAWRGYFPVGNELTSGKADQKEGIYFGAELPAEHPHVQARRPLHGPNLFPEIAGFRETVLEFLEVMTRLGQSLMELIAIGLELKPNHFRAQLTAEPTILFRIFHYPALAEHDDAWSVGEHTDYGLITILKQDDSGGLQVKTYGEWTDAPPMEGTLICNIGDMLDRMTGGLYRSTPHRVRNLSGKGRLSFPFFFDPGWDAQVEPLFQHRPPDADADRWDGSKLGELSGTYGSYLLKKIGKVFPQLGRDVLRSE